MTAATTTPSALPYWLDSSAEERRYNIILSAVLLISLLISVIIPIISVDQPEQTRADAIPPRLAKLVLQRKPPPPPAPVIEEPAPLPPVVEEPEPEPVPEPEKKAEPEPAPEIVPEPKKETARERASRSGLLALSSELSSLRQNDVIKKLKNSSQPLQRARKEAPAKVTPSLIDKDVTKTSSGIDVSNLSRDTGDTELAEHVIEQVVSPGDEDLALQEDVVPTRSEENIGLVFDLNKGRLNKLYNRALRSNPALEGKVLLKITIASSGQVSACEIISSELNDPVLERKIVILIKQFDFGPEEDVGEVTITYPLAFFPG